MIKKVNLILAPSENTYFMNHNIPPLALGIIKGYLESYQYQVSITDFNIRLKGLTNIMPREKWQPLYDENLVSQALRGRVDPSFYQIFDAFMQSIDSSADLFGISMGANISFFEIHFALVFGKILSELTQKPIVFGGNNMQYLVQFKNDFRSLWFGIFNSFHYLFLGPGEKSLYRLIQILEKQPSNEKYEDLPGAIIRKGNEVCVNREERPSLCKPDFRGLDLSFYSMCTEHVHDNSTNNSINDIHFFKWPYPYTMMASEVNRAKLSHEKKHEQIFIPYIFNYNCKYRCAFCVQSREDTPKVVSKAAVSVVDDIVALKEQYDSKYFYFYNNTFNYSRRFVKEFCDLVHERELNIIWSDCARFNNLDKELLEMMYQSGCRKLIFGFETGSKKILKLIDKQLDLTHAAQVVKWCHEIGIWVDIEVIVGLPYEFEEDVNDTLNFIVTNIKQLNYFHLNKYFVVPVSKLGRIPEKYGIELVKFKEEYSELLQKTYKLFIKGDIANDNKASITNFQVYKYNEVDGRGYQQIEEETNRNMNQFIKLYSRLGIYEELQLVKMFTKMMYKKNTNK